MQREIIQNWAHTLDMTLRAHYGATEGKAIFKLHSHTFSSVYQQKFDPEVAVLDIVHVDSLQNKAKVALNLYKEESGDLRFKLYHPSSPLPLSDILPVLENFGLKVIEEIPYRLSVGNTKSLVWIHDFGLVVRSGVFVDIAKVKPLFENALHCVLKSEMENDGFNRLIIAAGLNSHQIFLLRGYCKYLLQIGIPYSQSYLENTLERHPDITRSIVKLFEFKFDPKLQKNSTKKINRQFKLISKALNSVPSLDEDRIFRKYLNLVGATLRTNYFQKDEEGSPKLYLSFKIDSRNFSDVPVPRPHVEIFVHSTKVDAVHLRGGKVSRGGIRWSDRKEDFRTEILGLMKSQMTKNAIIVPVGAKGGFFVKKQLISKEGHESLEEAISCYKIIMRGLLDITDNLKGNRVLPLKDVIRYDDDDPYLVVAADKGTANFSDIANGVSEEYGFWLGDAFASGGSEGYDHKKMGITARGSWEAVKWHFRELGIDVMAMPFTCVGIGDMSGDVFGNGLLYSPCAKLLGAFNHSHIFVDPNPSPLVSYKERKRLFVSRNSSWGEYNKKLISKGGGVFDRSVKSIKVTIQMRKAFDLVGRKTVTPNELIHAILRSEVDLLWLGGIGTYIKASNEKNFQVSDRANDALRCNGSEIRAKVVGEGANLGVTQLGRIEYAQVGGRINTDFIDNSAGVACSDHEVNIKILLAIAVRSKKLTKAKRNRLLVKMTKDVSDLVLMGNYRQSMALTNAQYQSIALVGEHERFMRALEKIGALDREVEFLPTNEELELRVAEGKGLTRPELSVLLAYAKISVFEEVLNSPLPDDPYLKRTLGLYFPKLMQKQFGRLISQHSLRREIIATYVANTLVNRTGPSFVNMISELTGAKVEAIATAYLICRQIFGLAEIWSSIEALDNSVPTFIQTEMQLSILDLIKHCTIWFVKNRSKTGKIDKAVKAYLPSIKAIETGIETLLSFALKANRVIDEERYKAHNVPNALARRISRLNPLSSACDICLIAFQNKLSPKSVAKIFYGVGTKFEFDWLRNSTAQITEGNEWEKSVAIGVIDDLYDTQARLTEKIVGPVKNGKISPTILNIWVKNNSDEVEQVMDILDEVKRAPKVELAMLIITSRRLAMLV